MVCDAGEGSSGSRFRLGGRLRLALPGLRTLTRFGCLLGEGLANMRKAVDDLLLNGRAEALDEVQSERETRLGQIQALGHQGPELSIVSGLVCRFALGLGARRGLGLLPGAGSCTGGRGCRSEERRVGKECRSRWSP